MRAVALLLAALAMAGCTGGGQQALPDAPVTDGLPDGQPALPLHQGDGWVASPQSPYACVLLLDGKPLGLPGNATRLEVGQEAALQFQVRGPEGAPADAQDDRVRSVLATAGSGLAFIEGNAGRPGPLTAHGLVVEVRVRATEPGPTSVLGSLDLEGNETMTACVSAVVEVDRPGQEAPAQQ